MEKTIKVTGKGTIHVVPDVTRLTVEIHNIFNTYKETYANAKENAGWMVKILEYNQIDGKLAKTKRLDISDNMVSEYDEDGNHIGYKKDGYKLSQELKIDLGMDNVLLNKIIKGVGKFIKNAQIDIGYTVKDPRPSQLKMLERAVKDAHEKARIMAAAAGCTLGDVYSIDYSHEDIHIYSQARNIHSVEEAKACSPESLDITPDDLAVSDEVNVVWYLIPERGNIN